MPPSRIRLTPIEPRMIGSAAHAGEGSSPENLERMEGPERPYQMGLLSLTW